MSIVISRISSCLVRSCFFRFCLGSFFVVVFLSHKNVVEHVHTWIVTKNQEKLVQSVFWVGNLFLVEENVWWETGHSMTVHFFEPPFISTTPFGH